MTQKLYPSLADIYKHDPDADVFLESPTLKVNWDEKDRGWYNLKDILLHQIEWTVITTQFFRLGVDANEHQWWQDN